MSPSPSGRGLGEGAVSADNAPSGDLDARPMVAGRSLGERAVFFSCLQRAGPVGPPRQHDVRPRRGVVPVQSPLDPRARPQWGPGACFAPGGTAIQTRLDLVDAAAAGEGDSADLEPRSSDARLIGRSVDAGDGLYQ